MRLGPSAKREDFEELDKDDIELANPDLCEDDEQEQGFAPDRDDPPSDANDNCMTTACFNDRPCQQPPVSREGNLTTSGMPLEQQTLIQSWTLGCARLSFRTAWKLIILRISSRKIMWAQCNMEGSWEALLIMSRMNMQFNALMAAVSSSMTEDT
jgi:hypothetical protein